MKKKNGKSRAIAAGKSNAIKPAKKDFDISSLVPESNIIVSPKSGETAKMYDKLNELEVGQSYRMPMDLFRIYTNAKTTHRRMTKKVFISRKLDKYNFRCWRLADNTVLVTRSNKRKK